MDLKRKAFQKLASNNHSQDVQSNFVYAGFWWRLLACMIDIVILSIISLIIILGSVVLLYLILVLVFGVSPDTLDLLLTIIGINMGWIMLWLYYSLMESSEQQATPGKMIFGLKVVDQEGSRLTFWRASARILARLGHSVGLALVGLLILGAWGYFIASSPSYILVSPIFTVVGACFGAVLGSIAGYIPALFPPKRQALHDIIVSTLVVKTRT